LGRLGRDGHRVWPRIGASDQLFGQTWARHLGLGSLLGEDQVRRALASIFRYNFAPMVGPHNERWPPQRAFATDRDAGLFLCTWPRGGPPTEPIRYRDEIWTGIGYQVAAGMVYEGLVDEALAIVKAIDDRYDGTLRNPWNEVEYGDHDARAMASWGVFRALTGIAIDGPAGVLTFTPRLAADDFAAFFTGPEGWGVARERRRDQTLEHRIEVLHGSLRLVEVRVRPPATAATARAQGRSLVVAVAPSGPLVGARLADSLRLDAGDALELSWS
jgi:hypothetical protein